MAKFEDTFNEPIGFSDGSYVISGHYSVDEAAKMFSEDLGDDIKPDALRKDVVRFGFPPEFVEDGNELGACWYTGAKKGKGSKPVWVLG